MLQCVSFEKTWRATGFDKSFKKKKKTKTWTKETWDFTVSEGHEYPLVYYINSLVLFVRRQFCIDTAFSMAEPAGGGETHAGRTGLFYGRTRRWRLSVCRGPETQIPTNILIHLSSNIFVLGTYWNLFWKNGDFFFFFWPWKCGHFVTFFSQKSFVWVIPNFLSQSGKKFTPKKKKKKHCLMNPQTHHYGWMLHEMVVKVR
jgi:hypothetical protein